MVAAMVPGGGTTAVVSKAATSGISTLHTSPPRAKLRHDPRRARSSPSKPCSAYQRRRRKRRPKSQAALDAVDQRVQGHSGHASGGKWPSRGRRDLVSGAAFIDGADIVVTGARATCFGGSDDPQGQACERQLSGISTKDNPDLAAVSPLMDGRMFHGLNTMQSTRRSTVRQSRVVPWRDHRARDA